MCTTLELYNDYSLKYDNIIINTKTINVQKVYDVKPPIAFNCKDAILLLLITKKHNTCYLCFGILGN